MFPERPWHDRSMPDSPELDLIGWDVLAVGRRQTHLFVTFGSPEITRAERRLWIDTDFKVEGTGAADVGGVGELEPLVTLIVKTWSTEGGELALTFDDGTRLTISNEPNAPMSDVWYLTPGE